MQINKVCTDVTLVDCTFSLVHPDFPSEDQMESNSGLITSVLYFQIVVIATILVVAGAYKLFIDAFKSKKSINDGYEEYPTRWP